MRVSTFFSLDVSNTYSFAFIFCRYKFLLFSLFFPLIYQLAVTVIIRCKVMDIDHAQLLPITRVRRRSCCVQSDRALRVQFSRGERALIAEYGRARKRRGGVSREYLLVDVTVRFLLFLLQNTSSPCTRRV